MNRGFDLPDPRHHLVHTLRAAGYHTTLAGVQHVRWDPRTIGYHQILETGGRKAREVAPAAAEFLAAAPPQPFFLTVGFSEHVPQVELLVRAKVDRVLSKQRTAAGDQVTRRLFDEVRDGPARSHCRVEVKRQSARLKASKQRRKPQRAARVAALTLRYQQVELPCPGAAPVRMWMVHAREEQPPAEVEPLEWFLLTTLPVDPPRVSRAGAGR